MWLCVLFVISCATSYALCVFVRVVRLFNMFVYVVSGLMRCCMVCALCTNVCGLCLRVDVWRCMICCCVLLLFVCGVVNVFVCFVCELLCAVVWFGVGVVLCVCVFVLSCVNGV